MINNMKIIRLTRFAEEISVYCAGCKKHLRGLELGYGTYGVSHGLCPECEQKQMDEIERLLGPEIV